MVYWEIKASLALYLKYTAQANARHHSVASLLSLSSPAHSTEDYPHPLHMGVAIGKSAGVIRSLVMMFGVDKRDEQGRTPLMFAALANRVSRVV